jgi:adenylate cyclase
LLVWQGVRADRNIQRLRTHRRQFVSQSQAFSDLANRLALYDPADMVVAGRVTEIIVNAIQVRRASIWRLVEGKGCLFCEDAYDRESDGHTQGNVLLRHDFESFFEALEKEDTLMLSDAGQHPQTAELYRLYLHPLDCSALLMAPIRLHGAVVGALFFEGQSGSRTWSSHEVTFAKAIAGLLALRLQARGELLADQCEITPPPISQDATSSEIDLAGEASRQRFWGAAGRANLFYERLQAQGLDHRQLGAEVFSNIAVLALKLTNPFTLAETLDEAGGVNVLAHLVHHMEALATLHEIDYLKIMGSRIIAAAGFGADPGKKLLAVADMALTIQDRCRHVFADMDIPMEFRIGFDMGPVIGSIVGEQKNYYNLWGDAVIAATLMAEAGVAGGIHTTETVYRHLRSQYVFKKRGAYYLEETGEMQTYLLTSRL